MKLNVFEIACIDRSKAIDLQIAQLNAEKSAILKPIAAGMMTAIFAVSPSDAHHIDVQIQLLPQGEHRAGLNAAVLRHHAS